ncbi:MAG TPA: BON domain-containing protein [Dongiaceae bacterium]|nr:BON domain-containing protein [Dongiaceae bacterium]
MTISGGATVATAASEERGLGQAVNDNGITVGIANAMLQTDPGLVITVDVEVHEGRVLLAGQVDRPEDRVTAVRLAWQQPNVVEVINEIKVTKSETVGEYLHDVWLAQTLRNDLLFDSRVRSINYNVDCVAGTIYLMGVAQNQAELQRVIDHARDISYVRNVISFVRLKNDPARQQTSVPQPAVSNP